MQLRRLKLIQFKNYEQKEFSFSEKFNCLSGPNGMGKTNVLEAIYYLCLTKSHHGLQDKQLVLHGKDFFRLEGSFMPDLKVVAKVIPGRHKEFEVNGVPCTRLAEHVGRIPVVLIAPDDNLLVMEGSEMRRRFLDLSLSQLDGEYLLELIRYNKLLKQRNAALKQFAQDGKFDASLIQTYDSQMSPLGNSIYQRRKQFAEAFLPHFLHYHQLISGNREKVACVYRSPLEQGDMAGLLKQALERDRILQRTTIGVHKDDLLFSIGENPLKKYGSQGQIKSFVLALKLAQYRLLFERKGEKPLLLLDDLFDKLDAGRVANLLHLLNEPPFGQVFITHTESDALEALFAERGLEAPMHYLIGQGTVTVL